MTCKHGTRDPSDCWECLFEEDSSDALLTEAQTTLRSGKDRSVCYTSELTEEGDEDI